MMWLGPSARALLAYMSEASLKKGPAWFFIDYAKRWSICERRLVDYMLVDMARPVGAQALRAIPTLDL